MTAYVVTTVCLYALCVASDTRDLASEHYDPQPTTRRNKAIAVVFGCAMTAWGIVVLMNR